ncbi:succinate dehydrogenase, cytochrome b556 subunit [Xylella taiwanensis]|uniref:Succinate dehydrogenase cytochrome b556 subunit n=1 Tax=Xylella taiwanensis TaxID=1444770 RepID=Z9JHB5_9GAMM|nr:succinate dehydrogenase, cytochrome b556 subunit [Xylella taiwanensis]EWS77534.1 succinate dehydrogenase [Xylella taiwanensis]MCD8455872.1 succinate dehydrogenase, cytochrome b556 subunit [Xylella taiwanensis]MCD8458276.1 succinate dehydrogenase, cytochrome b556 subunit [Xylella taiwanensis]MCD8460414.1 succinate dehydrogenase, cytochrome b556 subunit [Xylella taiwanensis]MCD8463528.1 succinate dehydrogenase, cytochrome b556 subunit [Xylella taiwanensis]
MVTRERPLSPHLQIYRWQVQMVTSILHRATGVFLSLGVLVIAAGLLALMFGSGAWDCFRSCLDLWYGQFFLLLWTWCFSYHLCNGIRHIVQDFGYGFSVSNFVRSSWASVLGSIVITAGVWAYVISSRGVV